MAGGMDVRALRVSRGGFHGWLTWPRSARDIGDEDVAEVVLTSFLVSGRTYSARRVGYDVAEMGVAYCYRLKHWSGCVP